MYAFLNSVNIDVASVFRRSRNTKSAFTEDCINYYSETASLLIGIWFFYVIAVLCEHHGLCFGLFLCDIPDLYCMGSPKKQSQASELKIDQAVSQNQEVHMTLLLQPPDLLLRRAESKRGKRKTHRQRKRDRMRRQSGRKSRSAALALLYCIFAAMRSKASNHTSWELLGTLHAKL